MSGSAITVAPGVEPLIAQRIDEFISLRRDLHRHPELSYQETRTAELVAGQLESWGYRVVRGIAGTGVVATLTRGEGKRRLGLRADMDALPIHEVGDHAHASSAAEVMHACGHDGHTTILLAAADYLARHGRFNGTLHLFFQPAEEIGSGARRMISEGLFKRFPVDAVYGLHNWPGLAAGQFAFLEGPAMAAVDKATIIVHGQGGHGAAPHETVDPVLAAAHVVTALQSVVARNVNPLDTAVVTVGSIHGGEASNVIPDRVTLQLTIRSYRPEVRQLLHQRIPALARAQAESFGATAEVDYRLGFPAVVNHPAETALLRQVAETTFGPQAIDDGFRPRTASEDFAFFLQERPGSFLFVGNGNSASLHNPGYDFNDTIIAPAATLWARLAEHYLR